MTQRIRVSRRAASQIRQAAVWWAQNRPKAPELLADEIERGFSLATQLPGVGQPIPHPTVRGLRRLFLTRIHYHLYYAPAPEPETVEILALWHASRGAKPDLG